jgi:two-component system chemotaxis response regulator CheY
MQTQPPSEKTLLIVDDEWFMRSLLTRILQDLGHTHILSADGGIEALRHLERSERPVDLIFLDLEMPQISGFSLLRQIRTDPGGWDANIPVVVLTGYSHRDNLVKAANLGIHGFLVKPVSRALIDREMSRAFNGAPIDPSNLNPDPR